MCIADGVQEIHKVSRCGVKPYPSQEVRRRINLKWRDKSMQCLMEQNCISKSSKSSSSQKGLKERRNV
ncbi:hypothetical protein EUTSA_v10012383mg [Eutrema salsugineum]|uniref:Uncharacterized protein n=1 Tax=Eutrema salsugineum TaxID=72664 RepID=V4KIM5_EUTSA|nr:hypothetical protein EUTSA_v10012383mg [Eutrema salsugineum]